jgi:predicted Zn finger-like uncharacterized protein
MSLITRCPVCATMFKVVPDQLRVSDGWVRCGQCNEVFDANVHLQSAINHAQKTPATQEPRQNLIEQPVPPAPAPAPAPAPVDVASVPVQAGPVDEPFLEVNPRALHIDEQDIAPVVATLREQRDNLGRSDPSLRKAQKDVAPKRAPVVEEPESMVKEEPRHSFLHKAQTPATRPRPWARAGLVLLSSALLGGLLLQLVVHERDRIAATEPAARRFLEPLCEVLNCKLEALLQIEAVVIDSSSFAKVRTDVYRLSFALKNTAQTPVATPAVELTLTDMQDQAVMRRVFVAADFAKQRFVIEPGAELLGAITVSVKHGAGHDKVTGYRLLSFYP